VFTGLATAMGAGYALPTRTRRGNRLCFSRPQRRDSHPVCPHGPLVPPEVSIRATCLATKLGPAASSWAKSSMELTYRAFTRRDLRRGRAQLEELKEPASPMLELLPVADSHAPSACGYDASISYRQPGPREPDTFLRAFVDRAPQLGPRRES